MILAVKEKLRQAVRGSLICSQTVHERGIKFWRTNRSYLGKEGNGGRVARSCPNRGMVSAKTPGQERVQSIWGPERRPDWLTTRSKQESSPTWDGKGSHWMFLSRDWHGKICTLHHSRCSVENESERTREQMERPTWKEGEEEKIRANTQPCVNWEAAQ